MNKKILFSSILCGLFFSPFVSANDKVEKVYDSQRYQQVCKGKSQGTAVSSAYRGIIWNGTCEPQFFPSSKNANIHGDDYGWMVDRFCIVRTALFACAQFKSRLFVNPGRRGNGVGVRA